MPCRSGQVSVAADGGVRCSGSSRLAAPSVGARRPRDEHQENNPGQCSHGAPPWTLSSSAGARPAHQISAAARRHGPHAIEAPAVPAARLSLWPAAARAEGKSTSRAALRGLAPELAPVAYGGAGQRAPAHLSWSWSSRYASGDDACCLAGCGLVGGRGGRRTRVCPDARRCWVGPAAGAGGGGPAAGAGGGSAGVDEPGDAAGGAGGDEPPAGGGREPQRAGPVRTDGGALRGRAEASAEPRRRCRWWERCWARAGGAASRMSSGDTPLHHAVP